MSEYPNAEDVATTLEHCDDDLLSEARFVRFQQKLIEELKTELSAMTQRAEAAEARIKELESKL